MQYVRFVSKRETVPVFAATERDRAHTYPFRVGRLQMAWQADFGHESCLARACSANTERGDDLLGEELLEGGQDFLDPLDEIDHAVGEDGDAFPVTKLDFKACFEEDWAGHAHVWLDSGPEAEPRKLCAVFERLKGFPISLLDEDGIRVPGEALDDRLRVWRDRR